MALVFNWAAALGVFASLSATILAAVVYLTNPRRSQNRRLTMVLALEGLGVLGGSGMMYLTDIPEHVWAWQAVAPFFLLAVPFAYLLFLATLDTPLVRPLRHPVVEKGLMAGVVVAPSLWFVEPTFFVQGVVEASFAPYTAIPGRGFLLLWFLGQIPASIYGLVAAVSYWRRTERDTARRAQARSYAFAFGARDIGWLLAILLFVLPRAFGTPFIQYLFAVILPAIWVSLWVFLLAYGILKTQLFDIDLKIKGGLERSTVVGVFGVVFLASSELVETLVDVDGTLIGIGVAVAIGLVFRRIETAAERFADTLMPAVEDTEEYREARKLEVYRAAVEDAAVDEAVTDKERDVLEGLRENLDLEPDQADRIEADVVGASGGEG